MVALTLLQTEFARTASHERTEEDLRMLRLSVDRASRLDGAWEEKADAHAEFHSLLADATRVPAYSLLARVISGSVRDMIAWAGPTAGEFITDSHRRLIRHLETQDADGAAGEAEHYLAGLGQCQEASAALRP
jgi:GntR family transcriptional regulator, transcriptional repressor for pyruvate dehydrogenase complex